MSWKPLNTVKIAERCNVEFEFGHTKLPPVQCPNGEDNESYFRRMCHEGLLRHYGENHHRYRDRLEYELSPSAAWAMWNTTSSSTISSTTPKATASRSGRGAAAGAGSIAAYCIGITNIDPA